MTYFDSIIGQDSIKAHLSELVSRNALPHSLLFYGESGLGKLDMAIGLASLLLGRQVFSQPKGESYLAEGSPFSKWGYGKTYRSRRITYLYG